MVVIKTFTLLMMALVLGSSTSAIGKCADNYFKDAKINYPCKAEFKRFDDMESLMPKGGLKLSCYGDKVFPEPSLQLSSNEFVFKDIDEKKKMVMDILKTLYEKFLKGKIPEIAGIDEEELFCELCSFMIDFIVKKTINNGK